MATRTKNKSIKTLLRQLSLASIFAFISIAVVFCLASYVVWNKVDQVVEGRLQQSVENSQNNRDFGLLHSDIKVFQNTFFGDDLYLEREGKRLLDDLRLIRSRTADAQVTGLLDRLQQHLQTYLERGRWLNVLISWRVDQDDELDDSLQVLQEVIAERKMAAVLQNGDVNYFDQLTMLLSSYRESVLEIAKLNAEERRERILSLRLADPPPLAEKLDSLSLRLKILVASEPSIRRFGHHLISRVKYYRYLMRLYQLEMIQLNQHNLDLDALIGEIHGTMEQVDHRSAVQALKAREKVGQMIFATITGVLLLLSLMAAASWSAYRSLFRNHIQLPMELVSRRLTDFQDGDHSTPMALGRDDEWREIEEIFNRTLSALKDNVTALRASEKRYRGIFNNATEGIFRSSLSGEFLELNPSAVSMLGFATAEEAKAYYTDIGSQLYVDDQIRGKMIDKLMNKGVSLNLEVLARRKNGEQFWCSINNYLIRDKEGRPQYIEGTLNDVSERKMVQESLLQARSNLQNIIDSMPSVLIGLDREMKVTLWNKRAEQESILTAEEAAGKKMSQVCRLFRPEVYTSKLREALETQQQSRLTKVESLKKTADGGSRYFDILIYPLSSSISEGVVLHMDDVTERVRFEARMVHSEKMQSVGSLASGLAHEINNPLAAILQNVQVLSRRLSPDLQQNAETAEQLGTTIEVIGRYAQERGCEKMLRSITEAGQRAAAIVSNMQNFSRPERGTFNPCSFPELIERTLELASSDYDMRYHYDFQKIKIDMDFQTVPTVMCQSSHIQEVLLRLFKNAAQAMSDQSEDPRLTIRLSAPDDDHVRVQVEDNGPGMSEDISSRIFDPFYTTQEVGRGSGLGLSITYFIVTQTHKGSLSVVSTPGEGTCFDILLPVAQGS